MNFANYRDHAILLFDDFKMLPMSFLYFYNTACFITTLFTNYYILLPYLRMCVMYTVITQEQQLVRICINPELDFKITINNGCENLELFTSISS